MLTTYCKGFTLLELLLVLAIIALASAVLIPRLNSDVKLFDAQARELIAVLKYSRRMAVVNNRVQQVTLLPFNEEKRVSDVTKKANKKNTLWQSKGVKYMWNAANSTNSIKNTQVIIDFFPQGGATEGELLMTQNNLKILIKIDGFTGRVMVEDIEP